MSSMLPSTLSLNSDHYNQTLHLYSYYLKQIHLLLTMDFVNKAMGKEERSTQGTAPAAPQAGGQVQKDDYADKGKPSPLEFCHLFSIPSVGE